MAGGGPTIGLGVSADEPYDEEAQLAHILYMIESGATDAGDRFCIVDEDSEGAFIRAGSIALLQVALWALGEGVQNNEGDD